jgi:adenosylcobinamide-phosphate synthase
MASSSYRPSKYRRFAVAALALALDSIFADQPDRYHPVAWLGRFALWLEKRFYRDSVFRGIAVTAAIISTASLTALPFSTSFIGEVLLLWNTLGYGSLRREAKSIAGELTSSIDTARAQLKNLVGRETKDLDQVEILRAIIESVAENTADAVIGPLLWYKAAGPIGCAIFRAVNTLDAMFGHRSVRYQNFGKSAALLDDILVYPAASLCMSFGRILLGNKWNRSLIKLSRNHPSPNAGRMEALFSNWCSVNLGGRNQYVYGQVELPSLQGGEDPSIAAVDCAVKFMRKLTLLTLAFVAL